jgi:hypothetical protein
LRFGPKFRLHLLELPDNILGSLSEGEIQERHARALSQIDDEALRYRLFQ